MDCSEPNAAQTIFAVFYAVLYGAMLTSITSFKPFQWGFKAEKNNQRVYQLFFRLIFATLCFTVFPLIIFGFEYVYWGRLHAINLREMNSVVLIISMAASALIVYVPYRVYHIIFIAAYKLYLCRWMRYVSPYSRREFFEIIKDRNMRFTIFGQVVAACFYLMFGALAINIYLFCCAFIGWLSLFFIYIYFSLKRSRWNEHIVWLVVAAASPVLFWLLSLWPWLRESLFRISASYPSL